MKKILKKIIVFVLTTLAILVLKKYGPKIIAVTGSVGKTSTKDAIFTVLSTFYSVRKSEKSYNSETGVPLSILGAPSGWNNISVWMNDIIVGLDLLLFKHEYPTWLVLEVGADRPGDIEHIARWLKPDITVVTRFPDLPAHIEFFSSTEEIIKEKSFLAHATKEAGFIILNRDDEKVYALHDSVPRAHFSYGFSDSATLVASNDALWYESENEENHGALLGLIYTLSFDGKTMPVRLPGVVGRAYVYITLAALSVAYALKLNMVEAVESLASYNTPPGRLHLLPGIRGSILIDDTYNSSPAACEAGLQTLASIKTDKRKFAVLGDMLELGRFTDEAHLEIGKLAKRSADVLITVGLRAKHIRDGALVARMPKKNIQEFVDAKSAGEFLKNEVQEGDFVFVKGSQGVRMERTVEAIMAHPEDKEKLLVRQEPEWLSRQ